MMNYIRIISLTVCVWYSTDMHAYLATNPSAVGITTTDVSFKASADSPTGMGNTGNTPASTVNAPVNITIAKAFTPTQNVINWVHYLLNFTDTEKKPNTQAQTDAKLYYQMLAKTFDDFISTITDPNYTAYLKQRDYGRQNAKTDQEWITYQFNAYTSYQSIVDRALRNWHGIQEAARSLIGYETLVHTLGENSEITLRDRLLPFIKIISRLLASMGQ